MLFTDIDILDENLDYQAHQWVGVKDGTIDYIGDATPENAADYGETYDGRGRLLMPALYNAHTHLPMTLLRGYAENVPLQEWLNNLVWPFEGKMTPEDNYWATKLALAEMARYGSVSASDMYYATDERVQAVGEAHMKMNVCESVLYFEPKPFAEYPMCEKMERIVKQYHGAQDGRIRVDYNIHAEYTSNPITCTDIGKVAKAAGLPIHIHISETKSEHEECKGRHDGLTPVQYFESIGVFDVPVIAAHCVWVDDKDIEILAKRGATVALNPASNMKLASGFAPVQKLLDAGVNVALGTDGMASNNNHDLFQELYLMALVYKGAALDPADSIFTRLAGQTERLVTDKQLAEAVGQAPADTRAWLRAEIIRRFPEQVVAASWSHLTVRGESSGDENVENSMVSLDMSNPLKFTESLCSEAFEHVHTASGIVESLR